ncbi:MAG: sugar phosphate isomerase/epimerase [Synergistaceae bacterium]|jgi:sugar phosphate isomerase/epimerase|nr:sugar phosphate isomerase/epimerase [Synergistaceae bacterium]
MIKLGLVSAILPDLSFEEVIDYAAQVGFACVEFCCWPKGKAARRYAGVTHIDVNATDEKGLLHYVDYAKQRGIEISSLAYYPNPLDHDRKSGEAAIKHIYKLIDASALMGINMVTTFIGRDKTKTVEENLDLYEQVWTPIIRYAEEKKVRIGIENCPMYFTRDEWPTGVNLASAPYIWREMFRRIPSDYLGLNYDPSHLHLIFANYVTPIIDFKDKIFHVHFKDMHIDREKLNEYGIFAYPYLWHRPKLPGLGDIDFGELISALHDIRYKGAACVEVEDKAFEDSLNDVKSGIEQSYRYLKTLI